MNNLSTLGAKVREGSKLLSIFLTAGYPSIELTGPLVREIASSGADLLELGIPFSDPIADGPVIQRSSQIALRNGISLERIFAIVEDVRTTTKIPILLMGYLNPVLSYGLERFLNRCRTAGVDGTILADLPLEASQEYRDVCARESVAPVFLASPSSDDARLRSLDAASRGFLYCVAVKGTTGERNGVSAESLQFLSRVRGVAAKNPILAGFGIATPEDARSLAALSDGVIVGSAFIRELSMAAAGTELHTAGKFVARFRNALDSGD